MLINPLNVFKFIMLEEGIKYKYKSKHLIVNEKPKKLKALLEQYNKLKNHEMIELSISKNSIGYWDRYNYKRKVFKSVVINNDK